MQTHTAYAEGQTDSGARKDLSSATVVMKPRNFLLSYGLICLFFLLLFPVLDAMRLLQDPAFVYFVGRRWPTWILATVMGCFLMYFMLVIIFFAWRGENSQNLRSSPKLAARVLVTISVAITGLLLVLVAAPLGYETEAAYAEILTNCQFGVRTQRLYEYATVLHGIRGTAACKAMTSVKECSTFEDSMPYTGFLEAMETTYLCSGFCFGNVTQSAAAAAVTPAAANPGAARTLKEILPGGNRLLSALRKMSKQDAALLQVHQTAVEASAADPTAAATATADNTAAASAASAAAQRGRKGAIPPALFSTKVYQATCDGMVARSLRFKGSDAAARIYWEGAVLATGAIIAAIAQLTSLCVSPVWSLIFTARDKNSVIDM